VNIEAIIKDLNLKVRSAENNLKKNISGGYTGDLLSDVMANSHEGDIWITRQVHQNIVAVASLKDHAGIILVNSCEPAQETLEKAAQENIPIMVSDLSAFELSARVFNLLAQKD
jgi:serine kinase of HPr protein (carbohydrate metabolism regulator)